MTTPEMRGERDASGQAYTDATRTLDARQTSGWIGGVVLIAIGGFFLLQNFGFIRLGGNWWALFLFIPVAVLVGRAWDSYRRSGELDATARGELAGALVPLALGVIFLFGFSFGLLWPVLLIAAGAAALIGGAGRSPAAR